MGNVDIPCRPSGHFRTRITTARSIGPRPSILQTPFEELLPDKSYKRKEHVAHACIAKHRVYDEELLMMEPS